MPYYVYRVSADRKDLVEIDVFDTFVPAKDMCRQLRQAEAPESTDAIRMVFAKNPKEARGLLSAKHQPSSPLEEWGA